VCRPPLTLPALPGRAPPSPAGAGEGLGAIGASANISEDV